MTFVRVAAADDLWEGEMLGCSVEGSRVLIVRGCGYVAAYEDRCAHLGVRLSEGRLVGDKIVCRAHLWEYDARTGCGINPWSARLRPLLAKVDDGSLMVDVHVAKEAGAVQGDEDDGRVGPVLEANEVGRAIVAAIAKTNPDVRVQDRGSYLRVLARSPCVLQRSTVETELGRPFGFPGDLEQVMPSFKGRLVVSPDRMSWSLGGST